MGELGAVILAAGLSSRMREFKPLMELGGLTIISRVVRLMLGTGAEPVVVVTGRRAADIENHLAGENVRFVRNENYASTQMLDSILLGLSRLPPDCRRIFITPADIPLVRRSTLKTLLQTGGQFVRPTYFGKNGHPALMSGELVPALKQYAGDGGLRGAISAGGIKITDVETDDRGVLLDADTPEDYAELCRYFSEEFRD
ncbi:MAG: nucleotidyltransferase family protein [Clostridiales bacterium]|nr:nucleotidyltransferase family protein [Clostridiales bacterium]